MEVPTIAVAILGGAFDAEELGDCDIEHVTGMLEKLQEQMVTGFDDVHIDLIDRSHFERVAAERDALQLRLNAVEEENDRLRSALHDLLHGTFPSGWEDDGSGSIGFSRECIERCNNAKAALEKRP